MFLGKVVIHTTFPFPFCGLPAADRSGFQPAENSALGLLALPASQPFCTRFRSYFLLLQKGKEKADSFRQESELANSARRPRSLRTHIMLEFHHFLLLCTFARVPAGAFLFNLI